MIGSLYNSKGVITAQAAGFYAPASTPLPNDSITVFDELAWLGYLIGVGAASAGSFTVTISGPPAVLAAPVTTAVIAWNATLSAVLAAIQLVLPVGYTAIGSGAAPSWTVAIQGPGAYLLTLTTAVGVALTGGTLSTTPPAWTAAGGTEQGWSDSYAPNVQNIVIEEQQTPVDQEITDATFQFSANLSEDTINNLKLAYGASAAVQTPTTTLFGKTSLTIQTVLTQLAVALETKGATSGFPRRIYVPQMTCVAAVSRAYRRAAGQRLIPVTFTSVCPLSLIQVVEITANHS